MAIEETTGNRMDRETLAQLASACGNEVMCLWRERVQQENPSAVTGQAALETFIPVLYDNIAELIAGDMLRPFSTDRTSTLSVILACEHRLAELRADDVVEELQIFRGVIFSVARKHAPFLSAQQCEQIGQLIDATIRQAIVECTAADRESRETVVSDFSHDLRNPLNVASALAQLIQRRPDNEKVALMAARISEKIAETDAMIQLHVDSLGKKAASH